jgi:hypothetical protein
MSNFQIGDTVEVLDPGLLMLMNVMRRFEPEAKANNIGVVEEIWDDGKLLIHFPIGDDDPVEHSQAAPYPARMCRKIEESHEPRQDH